APARPAAIEGEIRARHEARPVARERRRGLGDVLRSGGARPGRALARIFEPRRILRQTRRPRDDLARRDAVAHDEMLRIIDGDLSCDVDRPGFAHAVRQIARRGHDTLLGPQVDQATPDLLPRLLSDHLLYRALAAVEHARQIDAHDLLPLRG